MANLIPYKGHDLMLEATASLIKTNKNFKVLIVGEDGAFLKSFEHVPQSLALTLIFLGLGIAQIFQLCLLRQIYMFVVLTKKAFLILYSKQWLWACRLLPLMLGAILKC